MFAFFEKLINLQLFFYFHLQSVNFSTVLMHKKSYFKHGRD